MVIWNLFEYAAWAIAAALLFWMLMDTLRVGRDFDESLLLSSREGADELLEGTGVGGEAER